MTPTHAFDSSARWRVATPALAAGAVACIEITGPPGGIEDVLRAIGIGAFPVGRVATRDLCGVDVGLVARWSPSHVQLMPHGGVFAVRAISDRIVAAGAVRCDDGEDPWETGYYPEARDEHEARVIAALGRTRSPRAIDLLLDQPRRWRLFEQGSGPGPAKDTSRLLDRLVEPPLVAAVGGTNIGKSSLTNALAKSNVSIVADERGTTRDHVGVLVNLDGLAVRFVDTPGIRPDADSAESRAAVSAWRLVRDADLLLVCGDKDTLPVEPPGVPSTVERLSVALRADLGSPVSWRPDIVISAATGHGIGDLSRRIRGLLVSDVALADPGPWRIGGRP